MDLGLRFREKLEALAPELLHEFERLTANINAGWLTQHTDDDGHGALTAYSLTLRKGTAAEVANGTKTGNIDADGLGPHKFGGPVEIRGTDVFGAAQVNPILLSLLVGISGTGAVGSGLLLPAVSGGGDIAWALINSDDSWHTSIGFFDATNNVEVLKLYRESAGVYALNPSEDGIATVKIGDRTQSALTFDEIAAFKFYERNDAGMGHWTTPAFNAGDFTASAGTWTVDAGDVTTYAYMRVGNTMTVSYDIRNTDVSNAGAILRLKVPLGLTIAKTMTAVGIAKDNGGAEAAAIVQAVAGNAYIELYATIAGGGFAVTAADNTRVFGQITFEIQ